MSDQRLRELARLAAQGDREAAEQLLRARHRAGAVPAERLRALALLGEPVSRRVLGGEWPAPMTDPVEVISNLRPSAHRALVIRAMLRVGEMAVAVWEAIVADGRATAAQAAARAWLVAIEVGQGEQAAGVGAAGVGGELRAEAVARLDAAGQAGLAVSGLAAVIEATGGAFMAQTEAFLERALAGGIAPEAVCEVILSAAREGLLEDLES